LGAWARGLQGSEAQGQGFRLQGCSEMTSNVFFHVLMYSFYQDVFAADETSVEESQSRGHEINHGHAYDHEGGIAGVDRGGRCLVHGAETMSQRGANVPTSK